MGAIRARRCRYLHRPILSGILAPEPTKKSHQSDTCVRHVSSCAKDQKHPRCSGEPRRVNIRAVLQTEGKDMTSSKWYSL